MSILIAIDNGHGINTPGKRTPKFTDGTTSPMTGEKFMHEWEFNWTTANYLETELKRCGFKTLRVSDTKEDTPLNLRTAKANQADADFFVSIHANALYDKWSDAHGVETLTWGSGDSLRVGKLVQAELAKDTGLADRGLKDGKWLAVVRDTHMPAILVECGFMSNLKEAKLLLSDSYRKLVAKAIAQGLCKAYNKKYVAATSKVFHTIEKGDTLWKIASDNHKKYGTTVSSIEKLNTNIEAEALRIGSKIRIK